ncbi:MAG TPA: GDSL-type esterase/lipase family protein [Vicinamibacterales bacterium]|nr:GDSL-type esterase/lipase family protein [Vicinamibacterales bacterium]
MRRVVVITIPALLIATIAAMLLIEAWVRWRWDDRRGTPGFYLSDPELGQRLAPGYDGWFAGVPVRINALGFRDARDYSLDKSPNTFRILVFGDSVTFGHGALSETTYPYLLEQRLKQWRPDIDWQVWNLGVPGYNTAQELKYLQRVGPRYRPDLVIIGFFENDLVDNDVSTDATFRRRVVSAVQGSMQRWLYSYEWYKRVALTVRWQWLTRAPDRGRLEALAAEESLIARRSDASMDALRQLTGVERFEAPYACKDIDRNPNRDRLATHLNADSPSIAVWKRSVAELQRLHREGAYRIAFFINMAPNECDDRFVDGGAFDDEAQLMAILGQGTPVGSSMRAYLPYRPSQMPGASGHSMGNANRVKADALFEFLTSHPELLQRR